MLEFPYYLSTHFEQAGPNMLGQGPACSTIAIVIIFLYKKRVPIKYQKPASQIAMDDRSSLFIAAARLSTRGSTFLMKNRVLLSFPS